MSVELDRTRIEQVLDAACERLSGDFVLVGGALVAVWLEPRRVTEDIDLVGVSGSASERFALMELAEGLGLPIEAVNSAADFFLFRIDGWLDQLELLRSGRKAKIFRPSPTLFLLLKIGRLSEQDLDDCLALLAKVDAEGLALDRSRVRRALDALGPTEDPAQSARRGRLGTAVGAIKEP
jgi:hypothetical protein